MMGITLTREPASIADLEEIVRSLIRFGADEGTLDGATFMVGTYLGEILRKALGGVWFNSEDNVLVLKVQDTSYALVEKTRKFAAAPNGADGLSFFAITVLARHA